MKRLISIALIILIPFAIYAQDFMTIGEVFDFEVNEEFHFKGQAGGQPPNADRIKIIDKYYSNNNDTVFYVQYHDSYCTTPLMEPPYIEYHFWTETDTIYYSNLNSNITTYIRWTSFDTTMTFYDTIIGPGEYYCDSLINGYQYTMYSFEPVYYSNEFGKGIGLVKNYYYNPAEYSMYDNVLFYYKKNNIGCGIADTTTLSLPENNLIGNLKIYPNPAKNLLRIENIKNVKIESISFTNINGQIIKQYDSRLTQLDISEIASGLYFLKISSENGELTKKIIIE